jgi:hypothetical protein
MNCLDSPTIVTTERSETETVAGMQVRSANLLSTEILTRPFLA